MRVDRHEIDDCSVADAYEEKQSIELKEALPIAYIFSDRIKYAPLATSSCGCRTASWSPRTYGEAEVNVRLMGGPGRLVGRRMMQREGVRVILPCTR